MVRPIDKYKRKSGDGVSLTLKLADRVNKAFKSKAPPGEAPTSAPSRKIGETKLQKLNFQVIRVVALHWGTYSTSHLAAPTSNLETLTQFFCQISKCSNNLLGSKVFPRKVSGIWLNPKTSLKHIRPMEDSADPGLSLSIFEMCGFRLNSCLATFFLSNDFIFREFFFILLQRMRKFFVWKLNLKVFFLLKKLPLPPNIFSLSRLGQSGLNTLKVVFWRYKWTYGSILYLDWYNFLGTRIILT